jgi:hypothetical protein
MGRKWRLSLIALRQIPLALGRSWTCILRTVISIASCSDSEPKDLCSVWTPFADTILWRKGGRELTSEIWPFCLAILAIYRESMKRYYFTLARILVWTNFMLYNIFVHDHRLDAWWCHDLNSRERPRTCILMGKLYPMISSSGLTLLDLVADLSHRTMLI